MAATPVQTDDRELTPKERRNVIAVTDVLKYWNTQDVEGILNFYHDDITWENVALEETYRGKDEVRSYLTMLFSAIPDLSFEVIRKSVRDDVVSERWILSGTHLGTFLGIPPTGRSLEIQGIGIVTMNDGKFLHDSYLMDAAAGLRQMGLLPPLSANDAPVMRAALWAIVHRKTVAAAAGVLTAFAVLVRLARSR